MVLVGYGQLLWLPQIIKGASGLSNLTVGVLSAAPPLAAAVAMVWIAAHSDYTGERRRHVALPCLVTAAGFAATAAALQAPLLATVALTLVAIGIAGSFGPFWGLATTSLSGPASAGGIALVNSIGNIGARHNAARMMFAGACWTVLTSSHGAPLLEPLCLQKDGSMVMSIADWQSHADVAGIAEVARAVRAPDLR